MVNRLHFFMISERFVITKLHHSPNDVMGEAKYSWAWLLIVPFIMSAVPFYAIDTSTRVCSSPKMKFLSLGSECCALMILVIHCPEFASSCLSLWVTWTMVYHFTTWFTVHAAAERPRSSSCSTNSRDTALKVPGSTDSRTRSSSFGPQSKWTRIALQMNYIDPHDSSSGNSISYLFIF